MDDTNELRCSWDSKIKIHREAHNKISGPKRKKNNYIIKSNYTQWWFNEKGEKGMRRHIHNNIEKKETIFSSETATTQIWDLVIT